MSRYMYRSPGGPPLSPISPSPEILSLEPESTPGGTFTVSSLVFLVLPVPRQSGHGSRMTEPAPLHAEHVLAMLKKPCWNVTCPLPPHVVQVVGTVPGRAPEPRHSSQLRVLGTSTFFSVPKAASSQLIPRSYLKSDPRSGAGRLAPPPPAQ